MLLTAKEPLLIDDGASQRLRMGIIGYGYWGPNLARNVAAHSGMELVSIADSNLARLHAAHTAHPWTRLVTDAREVLESPDVDAVVIATPPETHEELACRALENGKHVLVEKPLAVSAEGAARMVAVAKACDRTLLVDHTFLFTGAVRRLKRYIDDGELGDLYYFDSTRINLGLFQNHSNVVWDLAPHDVSILLHLVQDPIESVSAIGASHFEGGLENIAYVTIRFRSGILAHLHVNWLAPVKVRKTIIGGSKRMVVYDDTEASEKVKLYDSGADRVTTPEDAYRVFVEYRTGDILVPKLEKQEALAVECGHFVNVVAGTEASLSDGEFGLRVVEVLEAAQQSIRTNGSPVEVRS